MTTESKTVLDHNKGTDASVSNDTHPEKRNGKNWLKDNLTFLMVLLNGFILTGTAFAILYVFINEMRNEEVASIGNQFQEYVEESISTVLNTVNATAAIIELSEDPFSPKIKATYETLSKNLNVFDRIVFVSNDSIYDIHQSAPLSNVSPEYNLSFGNEQLLSLTDSITEEGAGVQLVYLSDAGAIKESSSPYMASAPLVLAKPVRLSNGENGYMMYISRISRMIIKSGFSDFKGHFKLYNL